MMVIKMTKAPTKIQVAEDTLLDIKFGLHDILKIQGLPPGHRQRVQSIIDTLEKNVFRKDDERAKVSH